MYLNIIQVKIKYKTNEHTYAEKKKILIPSDIIKRKEKKKN